MIQNTIQIVQGTKHKADKYGCCDQSITARGRNSDYRVWVCGSCASTIAEAGEQA